MGLDGYLKDRLTIVYYFDEGKLCVFFYIK